MAGFSVMFLAKASIVDNYAQYWFFCIDFLMFR